MAPEIRVERGADELLWTVTGAGRAVSAHRAAAATVLLDLVEAAGGTAVVTVTDDNGLDARTRQQGAD